jgi:uncharacterized SAM-binding protein YcdF (DUF218 family)
MVLIFNKLFHLSIPYMPLSKTIKRPIVILSLLIALDLGMSVIWTQTILTKTTAFEKAKELNAAVILMGDFSNDYTALGNETLKRLNFALSVRETMPLNNFICVGGSRPTNNIIGAELMGDYLTNHGVPSDNIYIDGDSFDTKSNWKDVLKLIRQQNWKTVGVISSALHLYRFNNFIVEEEEGIKVTMLPFPYNQSVPKTTAIDLWKAIHYEWITYVLYAMPDQIYNLIVSYIRPQQTSPEKA